MAPDQPIPLLEFTNATAPRHVVAIDGIRYTLRRRDDLSIVQSLQFEREAQRFFTLAPATNPDEAETVPSLDAEGEAELNRLIRNLCGLVLEAPAAVLDGVTPVQGVQILFSFLKLSRRPALAPATEAAATQ